MGRGSEESRTAQGRELPAAGLSYGFSRTVKTYRMSIVDQGRIGQWQEMGLLFMSRPAGHARSDFACMDGDLFTR